MINNLIWLYWRCISKSFIFLKVLKVLIFFKKPKKKNFNHYYWEKIWCHLQVPSRAKGFKKMIPIKFFKIKMIRTFQFNLNFLMINPIKIPCLKLSPQLMVNKQLKNSPNVILATVNINFAKIINFHWSWWTFRCQYLMV